MDLIDREAVKDLFERYGATEDFDALVDSLPAIDPVVHSRWIGEQVVDSVVCALMECNHCHKIRPVDNYCSHCGAKMYD